MRKPKLEDRKGQATRGAGSESGKPDAGARAPDIRPGRFALACLIFLTGWQMIKLANSHYVEISDQYGIAAAAALGLGSFFLAILGVVMMFGSLRAAPSAGLPERRVLQASLGARLFCATLGLSSGVLAVFFLYLAVAGRQLGVHGHVTAAAANGMAASSGIVALSITALAAILGLVGLFLRGFPLRRVPVFFLLGAMLLFTGFQTFRIHPTDWPVVMAKFSAAFSNTGAD